MTLLELAAKVEGLSGPCRETDAEIHAALINGQASHLFIDETPAHRLRRSYGIGTVFHNADAYVNGGNIVGKATTCAPAIHRLT